MPSAVRPVKILRDVSYTKPTGSTFDAAAATAEGTLAGTATDAANLHLQNLDVYFFGRERENEQAGQEKRQHDGERAGEGAGSGAGARTGPSAESEVMAKAESGLWIIYIHGGAWRDPLIDKTSIEPALQYLSDELKLQRSSTSPSSSSYSFSFSSAPNGYTNPTVAALASINYRLSPYPTHPTHPSFAETAQIQTQSPTSVHNSNPNPCAVHHPTHIQDVRAAIRYLQDRYRFGRNYIIVGHSCGATLGFQVLRSPRRRREENEENETDDNDDDDDDDDDDENANAIEPPRAVVGVEGIYNLVLFAAATTPTARDTDGHVASRWEEKLEDELRLVPAPELIGNHGDHGNDTSNLVERAKQRMKRMMDMNGSYADILRNAFGQQQQQQQQEQQLNHSNINDHGHDHDHNIETDTEPTQFKYIRQWHRASPTSIIKNTSSKINNSNNNNNNNNNLLNDDTLIVLAHSSADELVGWRQVDAMCRALKEAGWTVVRENNEEEEEDHNNNNNNNNNINNNNSINNSNNNDNNSEDWINNVNGNDDHNDDKDWKKRSMMKNKNKKIARIIDIRGNLGHDEIWQDGKALARIIAQSVRWIL